MSHCQIKLTPRRQQMAENGSVIKARPLRVSISTGARFYASVEKYIDRMILETEREIKKLFESDEFAGDYAMDANIGSQARILNNQLKDKFNKLFIRISGPTVERMVDQTDKNSAATLKLSMFNVSERLSVKTDIMTPILREMIAAGTARAVDLIRRVPAEYLDNISVGIYQAITTGRGLADIVPLLEKQKVKVKNWTHNVAHDQVRKIYSSLNKERLLAVGVEKYEWIHSQGSNHPREYHKNVLNGQIFRWDDPPIVDLKSGRRGEPGSEIFCRCIARPVIDLSGE